MLEIICIGILVLVSGGMAGYAGYHAGYRSATDAFLNEWGDKLRYPNTHTTGHYKRIREFLQGIGLDTPDKLQLPNEKIITGQAHLMLEEVQELFDALGIVVYVPSGNYYDVFDLRRSQLVKEHAGSTLRVAQECADVEIVATGILALYGIHDRWLLLEVDQANLRKFGKGAGWNEQGKWQKPKDWTPPDIKGVLARQKQDK